MFEVAAGVYGVDPSGLTASSRDAMGEHFGVRSDPEGAIDEALEAFTTTGFGSDAPWETRFMNVLVILMDTTGTLLIFLALPVLLFPALEDVLSTTVPKSVEDRSDHVVIATYSPRAESVIYELEAREVEYVLVEPDPERATALHEDGYDVIEANPETIDGLVGANLSDARAIVADVTDRVDTSIVLTAREISESVRVVSVVEDPERTGYHELAGADEVLSPRPLLGQRLAEVTSAGVTTELGESVELGEDFELAELLVRGSSLVGTTLAESDLREQTGVNVIGAWFRGEFRSPVSPDTTLESGMGLLVTGRHDQLARLDEFGESTVRDHATAGVVVIGYGEVGKAVTRHFEEVGQPYTVLDRANKPGVDIIGNADDTDALEAADIGDARAAILAIPDDTDAEFATLVMRDAHPDLDIAARTEDVETVQKMYRAGANYVLSLAQVTGRMAAAAVLSEADVVPATNSSWPAPKTERRPSSTPTRETDGRERRIPPGAPGPGDGARTPGSGVDTDCDGSVGDRPRSCGRAGKRPHCEAPGL